MLKFSLYFYEKFNNFTLEQTNKSCEGKEVFLLLSFQKKIYYITNLSHFSVVSFIVSYTGTHLRLRSRGFNFVQSAKASSVIRALNNNNRAGYKVSFLFFKTRTAVVQLIVLTFQKLSSVNPFSEIEDSSNTLTKIRCVRYTIATIYLHFYICF